MPHFSRTRMRGSHLRRPTRGFSLVELLTVIAVMAVLVSLVIVGLGKARTTAMKSRASSDLRHVGTATLAFVAENNGYLPGPSELGLHSYYRVPFPASSNLTESIAPYLGILPGTPQDGTGKVRVPQMTCPMASITVSNPDNPPPYFVQNYTLPIPRGRIFGAYPWGQTEATKGWMISRIEELGNAGETWMLTNADQSLISDMPHPNNGQVASATWFNSLPTTPVWGETRLRVYLDGHVEEVSRYAEP